MTAHTAVEAPRPQEERAGGDNDVLPQQWHGWGSPIGLGVGLLCVGGFFVLLALGLAVLDSIG